MDGTKPSLRLELASVLNRFSQENGSNTPDFILAQYLVDSLRAFDRAVATREMWYTRPNPEENTPFGGGARY